MDQQLSAIIAVLTRPNVFPLRRTERDEMQRMEEVCVQVNQQRSRLLSPIGKKPGSPKALLIHGWGGNPFMLRPQRDILQQLGYQVYMPFLLGHDPAYPEPCPVHDQVHLLLQLQQQVGEFDLVIAHSAGGVIAALAAAQGFIISNLILLAAPRSFPALLEHKLNESAARPELHAALSHRYALTCDHIPELMSEAIYAAPAARALIIHGTADRKIPFQDALAIQEQQPSAGLILVDNAGHLGLLQHQTTLQAITGYATRHAFRPEGAQHHARAY